jgi:hypothetical protein
MFFASSDVSIPCISKMNCSTTSGRYERAERETRLVESGRSGSSGEYATNSESFVVTVTEPEFVDNPMRIQGSAAGKKGDLISKTAALLVGTVVKRMEVKIKNTGNFIV